MHAHTDTCIFKNQSTQTCTHNHPRDAATSRQSKNIPTQSTRKVAQCTLSYYHFCISSLTHTHNISIGVFKLTVDCCLCAQAPTRHTTPLTHSHPIPITHSHPIPITHSHLPAHPHQGNPTTDLQARKVPDAKIVAQCTIIYYVY